MIKVPTNTTHIAVLTYDNSPEESRVTFWNKDYRVVVKTEIVRSPLSEILESLKGAGLEETGRGTSSLMGGYDVVYLDRTN